MTSKKDIFKDTIVAISSPVGIAAIGVIRLSGSDSHQLAKTLLEKEFADFEERKMYRSFLASPEGKMIDEVNVCFYKAPRSFTGEDMVEIFCHSGMTVLASILDAFTRAGARIAEPGEFTRRAFVNGKMDLVQAESIVDIIDAPSGVSLEAALKQRKGQLSRKVEEWRERILKVLSEIEADIDFREEELLEIEPVREKITRLEEIRNDLQKVLETAREGIFLREGIHVAIAGKPNVGKSSLLNALLRRDRAIVTEIPGTTRDIISERAQIKGFPVVVTDTAGIRKAADAAEEEGVLRAQRAIKESDVAVMLFDSSQELDDQDIEVLRSVPHERTIWALNKCDLKMVLTQENIFGELERFHIEDIKLPGEKPLVISALTGEGLDKLENTIISKVFKGKNLHPIESIIMTNRRHVQHLGNAVKILEEGIGLMSDGQPDEITALVVREAADELAGIIGLVTAEDVLRDIFSRFCIGK